MNAVEQRRALCRQLGPTPWAVLQDMVADAARDAAGELVVTTNVRRLASNLGLSKDTASRAICRLVDAKLVSRRPVGRSSAGTFGPGTYALAGTRLACLLSGEPTEPQGRPSTSPRRRRPQPSPPDQDSLFDLGASR